MGVGMRMAAAAALVAMAAGGAAQVPPEIAAKVRAGQPMDPAPGRLYAPMFPAERWARIAITRDLAYGTDPLQRLDIFAPKAAAGPKRPVLLFVHGGGFTRGDKHGDFYPDNITLWAAEHGMVGVNIDYRLAPKDPWPAGARDLAAAIGWAHANIARYGGDPDRIILWGHSAGANHVADYVAHPEVQGPEAKAVKGAIILSAFYATQPTGQANAYYGTDPSLQSAAASIAGLERSTIPLFTANAEFDPPPFKLYLTTMRDQLCQAGPARCPRYVYLPDHNHFTEGMAVGTADQSLTGPLEEWIRARR